MSPRSSPLNAAHERRLTPKVPLQSSMSRTSLKENWATENVPEDVWQTIFKMAILDDPEFDKASRTTRIVESSLHLSHVCSRFYNIIADVPDLWTDIVLRMDLHGNTSPREKLIILALKRASTKPLTLSVAYTSAHITRPNHASYVYLESANLPSALSMRFALPSFRHFALNVHRAKHMRIDAQILDITCICNFALNKTLLWRSTSDCIFVNHYAPLLEKLEFVGTLHPPLPEEYKIGLYVNGLEPLMRRAVEMSPKLHTLIRRRPTLRRPVMFLDLQIYCRSLVNRNNGRTYTSIRAVSHSGVREYSGKMQRRMSCGHNTYMRPHQVSACIEGASPDWVLSICGHFTKYSSDLFPFIHQSTIPKTLVLRRDREWLQQRFLKFVAHSAFHLERLVLNREQSTERQKMEFLCLLPNLKSLEIHSTFDDNKDLENGPHLLTDAFAKFMTTWDISRAEFSICPKLKYFGYDKNGVEVDSDDPVFSSMIEYRRNGAPGPKYLRAVSVCGVGRSSLYDIRRLLVLQKEGLDVIFYDEPCSKKFICRE